MFGLLINKYQVKQIYNKIANKKMLPWEVLLKDGVMPLFSPQNWNIHQASEMPEFDSLPQVHNGCKGS